MTDPVDTDALRELRVWLYDESQRYKSQLVGDAADELDRLRAELDAWEPGWRHMRDERDKARAVVENAPHGERCGYIKGDNEWIEVDRCTCWKADAL